MLKTEIMQSCSEDRKTVGHVKCQSLMGLKKYEAFFYYNVMLSLLLFVFVSFSYFNMHNLLIGHTSEKS